MKLPLLLLLALPFHAAAQYSGFGNINPSANNAMQSATRINQVNSDFSRQVTEWRSMRSYRRLQTLTPAQEQQLARQRQEQRDQRVALHRAAEQHALNSLADYAHYQDSLRRAHPAATAQLAAAQEQADAQELAQIAVKNYCDIFLPGQVLYAEQARLLSPKRELAWENINKTLLDDTWWARQASAQLTDSLTAYRSALVALSTELLGFDPSTAPKPGRGPSLSSLDAMRAKGPFDPRVADAFMQEAVRAEKVAKSTRLVGAINEFARLVAEAPARPEYQQNPQKMRAAIKSGWRDVNKEMDHYEEDMAGSEALNQAQATVRLYANTYLPK